MGGGERCRVKEVLQNLHARVASSTADSIRPNRGRGFEGSGVGTLPDYVTWVLGAVQKGHQGQGSGSHLGATLRLHWEAPWRETGVWAL